MSNWRGWISYSGHRHETRESEDHGEHAERLLHKHYRSWDWENDPVSIDQNVLYPSLALESKGWVRVVCQNSFSCGMLGSYQRQILRGLILKCRSGEPIYCDVRGHNVPRNRDAALKYLEEE